MKCKHIPDQQGQFHHLELKLKKYQKSFGQNWNEIDEPDSSITLSTKDKNNNITENSVRELFQFLEAQREIIFSNLKKFSSIIVDDESKIEIIQALNQKDLITVAKEISNKVDKSLTFKALKILADKSDFELSELIKLGFTPNKVLEKRKQISDLKNLIEKPDVKEVSDIQTKLSEMPWVFGPEYISFDRRDAGDEGIPDGRLKRVDGLSDILEVKLPKAELLRVDKNNRPYLAPNLALALGQLTGYLEHFNSQYKQIKDDNTGKEVDEEFFGNYYKPKGILLIGRRNKKNGTDCVASTIDAKPKVLRRVVSYFHWIDVLTYDDLIERAENSIKKLSL